MRANMRPACCDDLHGPTNHFNSGFSFKNLPTVHIYIAYYGIVPNQNGNYCDDTRPLKASYFPLMMNDCYLISNQLKQEWKCFQLTKITNVLGIDYQ